MKVFLRVPYEQRRQARAMGACWDPVHKKWYVVSRTAFMDCKPWWPVVNDEVMSWLHDTELSKYFGEAMATPNFPRQTSSYEPDRLLRKISSVKKKKRQQRRDKHHPHLKVGKPIRGKLARISAGPFSDSQTCIRSVTVKLPL